MEAALSYLKKYKCSNVNFAAEEKSHLYFCTVLLVFFKLRNCPSSRVTPDWSRFLNENLWIAGAAVSCHTLLVSSHAKTLHVNQIHTSYILSSVLKVL